ncbi:hypothetical protein [Hyalangium rubrum]|uniref:Secreted protein n=1 Tax=Hyalangium rubrum TaxID=3103134 RepID=A0ABU5HIM0_9BACT|nr:hypothetical protein [Hyalangium sp. s54d21]MDY7233002.1 hypothetical protein [Hyalangium sp. s54d21]
MLVTGALLLPTPAHAQPVGQRCAADYQTGEQAVFRAELMRWCGLTRNVGPADWTCPSEYIEANPVTNPWGKNTYSSVNDGFDVNATYAMLLSNSYPTSYFVDADGYCKPWLSTRRARPYYAIFGTTANIYDTHNRQLFLHPTQFSCTLYLDKNGTQPATGYDFYLNAFCVP